MATHSSVLAWEILWAGEAGGLSAKGSDMTQQLNNSSLETDTINTNSVGFFPSYYVVSCKKVAFQHFSSCVACKKISAEHFYLCVGTKREIQISEPLKDSLKVFVDKKTKMVSIFLSQLGYCHINWNLTTSLLFRMVTLTMKLEHR